MLKVIIGVDLQTINIILHIQVICLVFHSFYNGKL